MISLHQTSLLTLPLEEEEEGYVDQGKVSILASRTRVKVSMTDMKMMKLDLVMIDCVD